MIKNSLFIFLILVSSNFMFSQGFEIKVIGTLIEAESKQSVPYATIVLFDNTTKTIIKGVTSDDNGAFNISTSRTDFYIEISFMGYKTKTITNFTVANNRIDLGTIFLESDSQALDEVVIEGEVSKTVFKLDKRVFNVEKILVVQERAR